MFGRGSPASERKNYELHESNSLRSTKTVGRERQPRAQTTNSDHYLNRIAGARGGDRHRAGHFTLIFVQDEADITETGFEESASQVVSG